MVRTPSRSALAQLRLARGPGPTTEMEYSPTSVSTPPLDTGCSHSLMLMKRTSLGSSGMSLADRSSPQPQSQAMTSAVEPALRTPSRKVPISSPMVSQLFRREQRGHPSARGASRPQLPPCEKQLVWFSDMVMENHPPRSGTWRMTWARLSLIHRRTLGTLVHMA